MITFKQFLTEVFDKGYDFTYRGRGNYPDSNVEEHSYKFNTPNDSYITSLEHNKNSAEVTFQSGKGSFHDVPNQERGTAVKVFSTVKNIIRHHLDKHPHITNITFDASHFHPSRAKLYDAMIGSLTNKHTRQKGRNTYYSFNREDIKESFINEEYIPRIHHHITPRQLMSLSKRHGTSRWMIDSEDKLHAAPAYHYTHDDIADNLGDDDTKSEGSITYNKDENTHYVHESNWG